MLIFVLVVGRYVVDYETGKTNFKFATVQGAGHMVSECASVD